MWPFRRNRPAEVKPPADAPEVIENPEIPGRDEVMKWFGEWPSFHDAEILELYLDRSGPSWVKLHAWLTTNRTDDKGYFILEKHAVVTFTFDDISDLKLDDFSSQNVISCLLLTRRADRLRISLGPCYGIAGYIEAKAITVSLSPGKPSASGTPIRSPAKPTASPHTDEDSSLRSE